MDDTRSVIKPTTLISLLVLSVVGDRSTSNVNHPILFYLFINETSYLKG